MTFDGSTPSVLANPTYRRLFGAQVIALIGTGLLTVALGLLAYDLAGSGAGAVLGTALAIKMVAYVGVAPFISTITDRLPTKTVLVGADVMRCGVAILLPFVSQAWQIYVLIFILQAASATFTPAFQSTIPSVLPDEDDYTHALTLSRLAYDLEAVLSPIFAAILLSLISYHLLFLGTIIGFAGSAALVVSTKLPHVTPASTVDAAPFRSRLTLGMQTMWVDPVLRALLALNVVVAAATGLVLVNTVVYVRNLLDGNNSGVAVILACYGAGSMVVALLMPRALKVMRQRTIMFDGAVLIGLGLALTATVIGTTAPGTHTWVLLGLLWFALGAGTSMINTPSARLLRDGSTPANRRAVFTAQFSLSHAGFLLTYPLAGWVGQQVGQQSAAIAVAALATLTGVAAYLTWPNNRDTAGPHATPTREHSMPIERTTAQAASLSHPDAPDAERLAAATTTLRMLADPVRLNILWTLTHGEADVSELTTITGAARTSVSQHLAKLRMTGLVVTRKEGRRVIYSLADGHLIRLVTEAVNHADHTVTGEPAHW